MDTRLSLAFKYYEAGLDAQAAPLVDEVMAEVDPPREAVSLAATMAFERRDLPAALALCDRLLALDQTDVHALLLKGRALADSGAMEEALDTLERAVNAAPEHAAIQFNLGWVLQGLARYAEAAAAYQKAVALQNPYPVAWNNLGLVLEELGRPTDAVQALEQAIAQLPGYSEAYNNLGAIQGGEGLFAAAAASFRQAVACHAGNVDARANLAGALLETGDVEVAIRELDAVLSEAPEHRAAADNRLYADLYLSDDPQEIAARHKAWGKAFVKKAPPVPAERFDNPGRQLRVGFISSDFRRHSVGYFAEALLHLSGDEGLKTVVYASVGQPDGVTETYKQLADQWRDIALLDDTQVAELVRADGIDILVDLSGHTTGNRLGVLAERPAPLQLTGIGYPAATGLPVVDGWLCDAVTNPPGDAGFTAPEVPFYFGRGLHAYAPPTDAPAIAPLPAPAAGHVTFGSFNKLAKVSPSCVEAWMAVLEAVPGSRLMIKSKALREEETRERAKAMFAAAGLSAGRLSLYGWIPDPGGHLGAYNGVDIALDTFPYNGTTTTCEALWMGVPVLTMCGRSHAARVGASLLSSAGLPEWVAKSASELAAKAVDFTSDLNKLADLRAALRARVAASPLCDAAAYGEAFGRAVRALWQARCGG